MPSMPSFSPAAVSPRELDAVIVVEKNHGGAFLTGLLEQAMAELGVRTP